MHIAFIADALIAFLFTLAFWTRYRSACAKMEVPTAGYPMDEEGVKDRQFDFRVVLGLSLLFVLLAKGADADQQIWIGFIGFIAGCLFTWSVIRD